MQRMDSVFGNHWTGKYYMNHVTNGIITQDAAYLRTLYQELSREHKIEKRSLGRPLKTSKSVFLFGKERGSSLRLRLYKSATSPAEYGIHESR